MSELPSRLAALVDQARTAHNPSADDERRVAEALSVSLPGFRSLVQPEGTQAAVEHGPAAGSGLAPATVVGSSNVSPLLLSLVAIVIVVVGGVIVTQRSARENAASQTKTPVMQPVIVSPKPQQLPAPAATVPTAQASAPILPKSANAAPPLAAAPQHVRAVPQPHALAPATGSQQPTQPPQSASDASAELALIRQASQALRDRQPGAAWELLQQHAARFPKGVLTLERRGMSVIALCEQGRLSEGRALRQQFLASAPDSPLAGRVRNACADSPP